MNDNQAIIRKILSDAEEYATSAVSGAEAQSRTAIGQAEKDAEESLRKERENARMEGTELLSRRATIARLDGKKAVLAAKQEIVASVFDEALKKLCAAPRDEYFAFVLNGVKKYAESGDTVVLSESAPFSAEEFAEKLGVSDVTVVKTGDFKGGAVVSGAKRDTDLSFEALVADYYEKHSGDVARAIFGDERD